MEQQIAKLTINASHRAVNELVGLLPVMKDNMTEEIYLKYSTSFSAALYEMHDSVQRYLYNFYPELHEEYVSRLEKFGRAY